MIRFSHVVKEYEAEKAALRDITVFIEKGEFVFLTGPSGAGKTTLLKLIYMEELPSRGEVCVGAHHSGQCRPRDIPMLRRRIGIVFQDFRLLHDRDVYENVAFALRVTGTKERSIKRKVFQVLARTGLSHKCGFYPHQLSGGEQQRVCIARAIVNDPDVVLADEPTGNLDYAVSCEILELLRDINSWGTTIIMATHDLNLIELYPYRHLALDRGMLVQGSSTAIRPKDWSYA